MPGGCKVGKKTEKGGCKEGKKNLKIIKGSDLDKALKKKKALKIKVKKGSDLEKALKKKKQKKEVKPKGTVYLYNGDKRGGGARLMVIDADHRGRVVGDSRVIIEENEKFVKMTLIQTDDRFTTVKNQFNPSKDLKTKKITRKAFDKLVANRNLVVSENQSLKPLPIFKKKPAPKRKETEEEAFNRIFNRSSVLDDKFNM